MANNNSKKKKKNNNSMDPPSAEAAVSCALYLLESQPPEVLLPYLHRLGNIMTETRKHGRKPTRKKPTRKHGRKPEPPPNMNHLDDVRDSVLQDASLLGHILEYEGSLAYLHRHYYLIVGISCPRPHDLDKRLPGAFESTTIRSMLKRFPGKGHNALVNKMWCSLVLGQEGVAHWKTSREAAEAKKIRIAECTKDDPTVSWTARLCAMALCNDVAGLQAAFRDTADETQGYGAAMKEQGIVFVYDEDDDSSHSTYGTYGTKEEEDDDFVDKYSEFEALPSNHPFHCYCMIRSFDDFTLNDAVDMETDYLVSIAYCAARAGATDALKFLEECEGQSFWDVPFDLKGNTFLSSLVEYACAQMTLEGPVRSIRTLLMERKTFDEQIGTWMQPMLHWRHVEGIANHLHLAAATNHIRLIQALLDGDGGMDPSIPCENERALDADRNNGYMELPLPEDWADVRGHTEVAELLRQSRKLRRPNCQREHQTYKPGCLTTFFPHADRQYGFINGKVFVHLDILRECSSQGSTNQGFPLPGQKLHFVTATDQDGCETIHVVDGTDKSYLRLPLLERQEAEHAWQQYDRNATDYSEIEYDYEEESYGGDYYDSVEDRYGGDYDRYEGDYDEKEDRYGGDYCTFWESQKCVSQYDRILYLGNKRSSRN
eukprot:scaffold1708_cov61-Attheya_sp.AAC.2